MKKLPIQLVKTRGEHDIFKKEAGGGNDIPVWVDNITVEKNASVIMTALNSLDSVFQENEDRYDFLPVLMTATLHEKATAKSYRSSTRSIFDRKEKRNVIGVGSQGKLIIKIDNKKDLTAIKHNLKGYNTPLMSKDKRVGIAAIINLEKFVPDVDNGLSSKNIKVKLVDYLNAKWNEKAKKLFEEQCHKIGLEVLRLDYAESLILYRIANVSEDTIRKISTMDSVISVKQMPYMEITASPEPYNTKLEVMVPCEGEKYGITGLLDSGVEKIPHLSPWIKEEQNTAGLEERDIDNSHGTAVAGVMLYGDQLEGKELTGCKPMWLKSCIVNTNPQKAAIEEWELIGHIKSAIRDNRDVKVWNLSQGSNTEVQDNKFSDFAIALDDIQKECNVLICKSAGNQSNIETGQLRITQGADSIRSLVVGSISHSKVYSEDGEINHRSPFSRIGFGPDQLVKPDLVHYGGNMRTGIQSFAVTGFQTGARMSGTSFSTPRVTALAATLAYQLNREFDPILIKALLIHNAQYPILYESNETLVKELGYGKPGNINEILNNDADEFTMIWQPEITKGNDIRVCDFPFPQNLIDEEDHFYGDITVTLVTDPILKGTEGYEYCQSNVDVLLETYDRTEYYVLGAAGTPKTYRNADRLVNPKNVLAKDNYQSASFKSAYLPERTLIEKFQKYQPIKKYHVTLEKMRKSKKGNLDKDRKWCIQLIALYRDSVEADLNIDGNIDSIKATVIVTIKDTKHRGIVYDECMRLLELRNFEHNNVIVRQQIDVNGISE